MDLQVATEKGCVDVCSGLCSSLTENFHKEPRGESQVGFKHIFKGVFVYFSLLAEKEAKAPHKLGDISFGRNRAFTLASS